jgi:hypothetical protein
MMYSPSLNQFQNLIRAINGGSERELEIEIKRIAKDALNAKRKSSSEPRVIVRKQEKN